MELRTYQQILHDAINEAWGIGHRCVIAQLPTGGGKTITFAHIVREEQGAAAILAHRAELVAQSSLALARERVRHRIIGPSALIKLCVAGHMEELRTSFYDASAKVGVGSVQSIKTYKDASGWFNQVALVVGDECFPAGTLVDGRPIETIRTGDMVTAFDEHTGYFAFKQVLHVFKNPMPKQMVRLTIGHHLLECTKNHPIFTRRGWVLAGDLEIHDEVLTLFDADRESSGVQVTNAQENGAHLLQTGLWMGVSKSTRATSKTRSTATHMFDLRLAEGCKRISIVAMEKERYFLLQPTMQDIENVHLVLGDNGAHQSKTCVCPDENQKSYAQGRDAGKSIADPARDGSQTIDSRWEWDGCSCRDDAVSDVRIAGLRNAMCRENGALGEESDGSSDVLQTRSGASCAETWDRSGRHESRIVGTTSSGHQERQVSDWVRVDRVEIYEQRDREESSGSDGKNYVYNLEVADWHTYVANDVVVHNCHHYLADNQFGKALARFPRARFLGVTATPGRTDGKGLGRHADGVADILIQGPTGRELIEMGYLSRYKIMAPPPQNFDRGAIHITASGEFSPVELRAATKKSTIMGDVVAHYIKHASNKLGLTFADSIENATEIARNYRAAGVKAEVLTGETEGWLRAQVLRQFKNREVMQIVSVALIDEGFDCPAVEVVSDAAATESFGRFAQRFGRGLRIMDGKTHMLYLDHVGNTLRHGLPDAHREWSLDRRERRTKSSTDDAIPLRVCANPTTPCAAVYERYRKCCPICGYVPVPVVRSGPEFVDGDLTELDVAVLAKLRGEVERIDGPAWPAPGMTPIAVRGLQNAHYERQQAQAGLRATIALWGGWKAAMGHDDSESYRMFYHRYGMDVMTAKALGRREATELQERISAELNKHGVIEK